MRRPAHDRLDAQRPREQYRTLTIFDLLDPILFGDVRSERHESAQDLAKTMALSLRRLGVLAIRV